MKTYTPLLLLLAGLAGCATQTDRSSITSVPNYRPVRSTTVFTNALHCMDGMFLSANKKPITLMSDNIEGDPDRQAIIKEMVIHAVKSMGANSGAITYVDFDPKVGSAVFHLLSQLIQTPTYGFTPPDYYIRGALSGEVVEDNKLNLGAAYSRFRGSFSKIHILSNLKVNLSLGRFVYNGNQVTPQILEKAGYTFTYVEDRLGGRLSGNLVRDLGLSVSLGHSYIDSELTIIQSLVELAAIEMIGIQMNVPYWLCLQLDSTDPGTQERIRDWYDSSDDEDRLRFAQQSLKTAGYYNGNIDGIDGRLTRQAITRFQQDHHLIPTGRLNLNVFLSLSDQAPAVDSDSSEADEETPRLENEPT